MERQEMTRARERELERALIPDWILEAARLLGVPEKQLARELNLAPKKEKK